MATTNVLVERVLGMEAVVRIRAGEKVRTARAGRGVVAALVGVMLLAGAGTARAHEDPSGCFETGPAIIVSVFRANGTTGVVGNISECETINYRATLQKATNSDTICAFSAGIFRLTTPDGVVHDITLNVPCIGGTAGEGCDPTVTLVQSALIPYLVSSGDVVGGFVTATASYAGGVAHDAPNNTAGVAANTPKSTPVVLCTDNNLCTTDVCDPALQSSAACSFPPVVCVDNDLCTLDACNPANGQCTFTPNVVCDDNSLCTSDACNPATGTCVFTPTVTCTDNNLCTQDSCVPATGQCQFVDTVTPTCNDNNLCTQDSCDPATGLCVNQDTVTPTCNDNSLCTTDSCDPATGLCVFTTSVTCNDNDLCTSDACNPATGLCVFTPSVTCNDNNLCTQDSCVPATGQCQFVDTVTSTCNDNNLCTQDSCDPATGLCVNQDTVSPTCNDNNLCTTENCDPATGQCVFTPTVTCNDNSVCTTDTCNPTTGLCVFTPTVTCVDNNVCTDDRCDPADGCVFTDNSARCNDEDVCTDDSCHPTLGCQNVPNTNPICLGLNHFQCYEIKPFAFARRSVSVEDRYADRAGLIQGPDRLCAPSDKRGEDPTAASDPEHLIGYPNPTSPIRINNQSVTNQFGSLKLDLIRRKFLMVPTAKSLQGPPPPLANPLTDHFQCYQVRRSSGQPRFVPIRGVAAVDQFGSHAVDLLRPRFLCVPANKNDEDPGAINHTQNLLCYRARHRSRFPQLRPFTTDQFGTLQETITRRMEFCVPSALTD